MTCGALLTALKAGKPVRWLPRAVSGLPGDPRERDLFVGSGRVRQETKASDSLSQLVEMGLVAVVDGDGDLSISRYDLI